MSLSILTLNIWHNSGPYAARRERIRDWITRLNPDVIGFQEALRGESFDQIADLLTGFDYHTAYVPAVPFWNDESLEFGNAVASRWPITDHESDRLPDAGDNERRAALSVTIDAPFGPVGVTVTHLNWRLHHGWVREKQVVAVCELARRTRPRGGFPAIMLGDFNAEPDSSEVRYVKGLQSLNGSSTHFRDAWAVAGTGSDGITWSNRNPYARFAYEPERRIDYIFVGPPTADARGAITHCRVVCDDDHNGVFPSDHFGLYAELVTEAVQPRSDNG